MIKGDGNPYVSFKNDRDRLWAFVSRDARIVFVAGLCAYADFSPTARALLQSFL